MLNFEKNTCNSAFRHDNVL